MPGPLVHCVPVQVYLSITGFVNSAFVPHFRSTCLVFPHFTGWQCECGIKGTEYSEVEKNLLYVFPSEGRRREQSVCTTIELF